MMKKILFAAIVGMLAVGTSSKAMARDLRDSTSRHTQGEVVIEACKCGASVVQIAAPSSQPHDSSARCNECTTKYFLEVTNNGNCEIDQIEVVAKTSGVSVVWGWIEPTGNVWEHSVASTNRGQKFLLIPGKSGAGAILGVGGKNRTFIIELDATAPNATIVVSCTLADGTICNSKLSL